MESRTQVTVAFYFFFNDTTTTEIYTLSLHDALPISNKFIPTFFNEKTLKNKVIEDNVDEKGEIALFSCSTGTPGGLAKKLSKTAKRTVRAATEAVSHMEIDKKDGEIHFLDKGYNEDQTITWTNGEAKAINEHDSYLIEEEKKLKKTNDPEEAKKILKGLEVKKSELRSIRNKNGLKSIFLALFFAVTLTALLIFIPHLFLTMTLGLHIVQGLIIAYIWFFSIRSIRSGVGNKFKHVNKLIDKAKIKSKLSNKIHKIKKHAFELQEMSSAS